MGMLEDNLEYLEKKLKSRRERLYGNERLDSSTEQELKSEINKLMEDISYYKREIKWHAEN